MTIVLHNRSEQISANTAIIGALDTDISLAKVDLSKLEAQAKTEAKVAEAIEGKLFKIDPRLVNKERSLSRFKIVRFFHSAFYVINALFNKNVIKSLQNEFKAQKALVDSFAKPIVEHKAQIQEKEALKENLSAINAELQQINQDVGAARKTIIKTALGFAAVSTAASYAPQVAQAIGKLAKSAPDAKSLLALVPAKCDRAFVTGISNSALSFLTAGLNRVQTVDVKPAVPFLLFAGVSAAGIYALKQRHDARMLEDAGHIPTEEELAANQARKEEVQRKMTSAIVLGAGATLVALNRPAVSSALSTVAQAAAKGASRVGFGGAAFIAGACLLSYVLKVRHAARTAEEATA